MSALTDRLFGAHLSDKVVSRSWWRRWVYPLLFLLTLTLSLATYLSLDSIQQSINTYITDNQRALVGGDLVLNSKQDLPAEIVRITQDIDADNQVKDYQFSAMLISDEQTLLAQIKAVSDAYPLYGEVKLASGKPLWQVLAPSGIDKSSDINNVVVAPEVLTGLGADIGTQIQIGDGTFIIQDVLDKEPDRPLTAFGFGGRVLMPAAALDSTNLIGQRSRVNYRLELAVDNDNIEPTRDALKDVLTRYPDIELTDAKTADTSVTQISDNVLMFLKLLVIAVLLLSAVAMYGVITAFIAKQQTSNAVRVAMGETVRAIKLSYYRQLLLTALIACLAATLLSVLLLQIGQPYLGAILPADLALSIRLPSVIKTVIIALILTLLITQRGLHLIGNTKPAVLLGGHDNAQPDQNKRWYQTLPWLWYGAVLLGVFAFLAYEIDSVTQGLQLLIGVIVVITVFWLLARGWLLLLSKLASKVSWMPRLAIHNLARKGNQSALFFVTLSLSVAVLTLITTLNHSINAQFISAYPDDAPNLFLLDVQSDQHDDINNIIGEPVTYYPVIRARVVSAGGVPVDEIVPRDSFDDPTRVFNLSYADSVMDTEYVVDSVNDDKNALYAPIKGQAASTSRLTQTQPLSILDTAADLLDIDMGDTVRFNIQGIEITGQITSIRSRFERGPSPFFYFLFEPELLAKAPQIQFATAHVATDDIADIQGELTRAYPAITTIDGTAIAAQIKDLVGQLSRLVYVFTMLAIITGVMVLISSLLATSQDRMTESASFRLLGMQKRDLYTLNILEIGVLGMSAALFAVTLASVMAWGLITYWFDLTFSLPWVNLMVGGAVLLLLLIAIAVIYVRLVIGRGIMARVRGMV